MSAGYQPFPIKEFKSGIDTYLQPWIRPVDAFEPLTNAYVYRGSINKRAGMSQFGETIADSNPVMGLMRYINQSTGLVYLLAATTANLYIYNSGTTAYDLITSISDSSFWQGTTPASGTKIFITFWLNVVPSSVTITAIDPTSGSILDTMTDNGLGGFNAASTGNVFTNTGSTITYSVSDYVTSNVKLGFTNAVSAILQITATIPSASSEFSGNITNFFNYTNWQPTAGGLSYIFMTNDVDPITLYNGTSLSRPILYVDSGFTQYINTCLDVVIYKQRLLLFAPTLSSSAIPENQTVYWSAQLNATNFVTDVAGNGGFLAAPTGDVIQSVEFIRDDLIVFFSNSTWLLKFNGNASSPFQWIKLNNSKSVNAPYGSISYDERATTVGRTGLIACDGVNVQRYDTSIIDYYETNFSQQYYAQTFSQRYDNLNQSWMLYVSNEKPFPLVDSVAPGSDSALIYNFAENSWATYSFSFPLTCLGSFYRPEGVRWQDLTQAWNVTEIAWNSYSSQETSLILLAGGVDGKVYYLDDESQVTDAGSPIVADITSTRWNPIIDSGQKLQFGYIDIYYNVSSLDPSNPVSLNINFYVDNSENIAATRTLTLDGPVNSEFYFKRIYINLIGQFVRLEFEQPPGQMNSLFQLLGFILWVRPAGRLTP